MKYGVAQYRYEESSRRALWETKRRVVVLSRGATEETQQSMAVTIAKADGTNAVHYSIEASSRFETLLVTGNESAEK